MAYAYKLNPKKRFELVAHELGWTIGSKLGQYYMDYVACYGGYQICVHINDTGGIHCLNMERYKRREMLAYLDGMLELSRIQKEQRP